MHSTFSLVALDLDSGLLGMAIATRVPAVGSICPYLLHGVGAVCTQAWTNPYLGPDILEQLSEGKDAEAALATALSHDPAPDERQVGLVAANGATAAHSGSETEPWSGHLLEQGLAIQGNFLEGAETLEAMRRSYRSHAVEPFDDIYDRAISFGSQLLEALAAGNDAGGDSRGNRSAAVRVVGAEIYPLVDLRVDDHAKPIQELRRVFEASRDLWFPFLHAMPSREDRRGDWSTVRAKIMKKAGE